MQELAARTFLVTGASAGIGYATALDLARRGAKVYVACRPGRKGEDAVASIAAASGNDAVELLRLDLADLASVRACAAGFLARDEPLHALINNAGVAGRRGVTADGFELAFGVNHLGHFALATALLGRLAASAPARVVTVASAAHYRATGIDFAALRGRTRSFSGLPEYAVSKLCNVLFAQELGRRMDGRGVTAYAVHPGVVASDIWRRIPWPLRSLTKLRMESPSEGARTPLYCATSPAVAQATGRYYDACRVRDPGRAASPQLAQLLWERSEAWTRA